MDLISNPKRHGLTQKSLEEAVADFCAGCPDPTGAYRLIAENPVPITDEDLVSRAREMPFVQIDTVSKAIVPGSHPARNKHG